MCGRFVLATKPSVFVDRFVIDDGRGKDEELFYFSESEIEELKQQALGLDQDFEAHYNIAPRFKISAIARVDDDHPYIAGFKWGLLPPWAKDPKMGDRCFNSRSETAAEKPMFRSAFKHSRCAVLADGYYEWKKTSDGVKQPYFIHRKDSEPMFFAGLCEPKTQTATIMTCDAQGYMADIHDRRPVFLNETEVQEWLDPKAGREELMGLLQTSSAEDIEFYPVSTDVNRVGNNEARFIKKVQVD